MDTGLSSAYRRAALGPRTLTAVVGIPVLLFAMWAGGLWWIGLTAIIAVIGRREFVVIHAMPPSLQVVTMLLLPLGGFAFFVAERIRLTALIVLWAAVIIAAMVWYFSAREKDRFLRGAAAFVVAPLYLAAPAGLLMRWRYEFSPWSILAFLLVIWMSDIAAYFVGIAAGRHKLAPRISPGKSWEGAVAGVVAGGAVGVLMVSLLGIRPVLGLVFGVFVTVASQIGDLFESAMKRKAGVKDSGAILPGHGGILDRFDGIFVAAPIAYVLVRMLTGQP